MEENFEDILNYMPEIDSYEKQLCALDDAWESIKLITEVSCPVEAKTILPSMISTQRGFQDLQKRLVENLIIETLNKQARELTSRAQVAVDILIRNLFERTADVGFLATDADIRKFLAKESGDVSGENFIKQRLVLCHFNSALNYLVVQSLNVCFIVSHETQKWPTTYKTV